MFQTILSVTNKIPLYCTLHPAVYLTIFTCICSEELQAGCYACFPFVVRLFYFVRSVVVLLSIVWRDVRTSFGEIETYEKISKSNCFSQDQA